MIKLIFLVVYFTAMMALAYWLLSPSNDKTHASLPLRERAKVTSWRILAAAVWSLVLGGLVLLGVSKELASLKYLFS
jgi:hypothetical protein